MGFGFVSQDGAFAVVASDNVGGVGEGVAGEEGGGELGRNAVYRGC